MMKSITLSLLLIGTTAAHSAVQSIKFDGTVYPARNAQYDKVLGAQRVEWNFDNLNGFPWLAVTDVLDPAIACGLNSTPPELKAVARAGSNVTVQWSGIIRMHLGPVMTYLGAWNPGMKAQDVEFFKIGERGYDKAKKLWANEELIEKKTVDVFQLPSDIKPGIYVLRTELLALHGNSITPEPVRGGGPQFYTHCFNVQITGGGNANPTPKVRFPGAYKRHDAGVAFNLRNKATWDDYIIPGPPVWRGQMDKPVGAAPDVSLKDTGAFPPEIEAKYEKFKSAADAWATRTHNYFNDNIDGNRPTPTGEKTSGPGGVAGFMSFLNDQYTEVSALFKLQTELKGDLKNAGYQVSNGWFA